MVKLFFVIIDLISDVEYIGCDSSCITKHSTKNLQFFFVLAGWRAKFKPLIN